MEGNYYATRGKMLYKCHFNRIFSLEFAANNSVFCCYVVNAKNFKKQTVELVYFFCFDCRMESPKQFPGNNLNAVTFPSILRAW